MNATTSALTSDDQISNAELLSNSETNVGVLINWFKIRQQEKYHTTFALQPREASRKFEF